MGEIYVCIDNNILEAYNINIEAKKGGNNMRKLQRILFVMVLCGSLSAGSLSEANAYVKNGYKLSAPKKINFGIDASAGTYAGIIPTYTKIWGNYCSEIGFSSSASQVLHFEGYLTTDNDTYAVTYHSGNDSHTIIFYKSFVGATAAEKQETIVHEVGHVLGLAHCQASKNSSSVMRETGFNGKAYPLSDDISGISAIY